VTVQDADEKNQRVRLGAAWIRKKKHEKQNTTKVAQKKKYLGLEQKKQKRVSKYRPRLSDDLAFWLRRVESVCHCIVGAVCQVAMSLVQ
jgi:hypothetical protein